MAGHFRLRKKNCDLRAIIFGEVDYKTSQLFHYQKIWFVDSLKKVFSVLAAGGHFAAVGGHFGNLARGGTHYCAVCAGG